MSDSNGGSTDGENTIEKIAESFLARYERGERPSIEEYKKKCPQLAERIESVLPALVMLENVDSWPATRKLAVDDSIPQVLGEYEIIQEVGRGGMGIVFEARHTTMRRRVALKVLPKSAAVKTGYRMRFLTEARSAGQLHHTNIVPVFEVGEAEGIQYYAMQFIFGENLDRIIDDIKQLRSRSESRKKHNHHASPSVESPAKTLGLSETIAWGIMEGGLRNREAKEEDRSKQEDSGSSESRDNPAGASNSEATSDLVFGDRDTTVTRTRSEYHRRIATVIVQVAEALEHAHNHGVLHRDIKPANLILDTSGNAWVTDFGLAKVEADDLTQTGDVVGTLRYMAPERFKGDADRRSDIYSLGLTLYELCTLKCAFDSGHPKLLTDMESRTVVSPRSIDDTIPPDLETIILKSVETAPERRYQTAGELAEDLSLFLADRPIKARRVSVSERFWRVCRRNPVASLMLACIATLLVVMAIGSLQFAYHSARQTEAEILIRKESQRNLYLSKFDQAQTRRLSKRIGQRFQTLNAIQDAVALIPDLELSESERQTKRLALRNEAIAALSLLDMRPLSETPLEKGWGRQLKVAYSRSYDLIAEGHIDGRIRVRSVNNSNDSNNTQIELPSPGQTCSKIKMSPNGRYLAAIHHPEIGLYRDVKLYVWDLNNIKAPLFTTKFVTGFDFSANNQRIAFAGETTVNVVSLATGDIIATAEPAFVPRLIKLSRDGNELVTTERGGIRIEQWLMSDQPKRLASAQLSRNNITALDWRDTEEPQFAVGTTQGEIYYWQANLQNEPTKIVVHQSEIKRLHIHPTKNMVVSDTMEADVRLTDLKPGSEPLRVNDFALLLHTGFSSEGNLCYADQQNRLVGIWEVALPLLEVYPQTTTPGRSVRFNPTKTSLVARSSGTNIELWDLNHRKRVGVLDASGHSDFCFSRDGLSLFTSGANGLRKWPLNYETNHLDDDSIQFGEPETLIPGLTKRIALGQSGRLMVVEDFNFGASVYDVTDGTRLVRLGTHGGLDTIELTADDQHVLTGTFFGKGVGVWQVKSGKRVAMLLPKDQNVVPVAHPKKGDCFVSVGGHVRFWELENLDDPKPVNHVDIFKSRGSYSDDGSLLAVQNRLYEINLLASETGTSLASISTAENQKLSDFRFSPDGKRIALSTIDNLQVLNLAKLREQLASLKLDWD